MQGLKTEKYDKTMQKNEKKEKISIQEEKIFKNIFSRVCVCVYMCICVYMFIYVYNAWPKISWPVEVAANSVSVQALLGYHSISRIISFNVQYCDT